ncbi:RrF2 family transcriptional regulator [Deinococcus roseus]|uniref:Transcriptional regulator n=1 Tax=Deinococcus roseus TaxID=392414 RepID=A0ABQ2CXI7_9DEIO|nr:Rrf2 family transcriptional regulator [Deinococcus roseus]GGJ23817.1 transcriptional regulator [Deinococcus roseus]
MKFSEGIEWSIHCVAVLAGIPSGATLSNASLAEYHGVSESYLVKHLKALVKAGILESVPGPRGGFRIARLPAEITLLQILEAIEGREPMFQCEEIRGRFPGCPQQSFSKPCSIHAAMLKAELEWRKSLQGTTIQDINAQVKSSPERQQADEIWMQKHLRLPVGQAAVKS